HPVADGGPGAVRRRAPVVHGAREAVRPGDLRQGVPGDVHLVAGGGGGREVALRRRVARGGAPAAAVPELQHRRESPLRVRRARGHGGLCVLASSHPSLPSSSSPAPGAAATGPTRTWSSPLRCPTAPT